MRRPIKYLVVAAMLAVMLVTAVGCKAPEETVQRQPADLYRGDLSVTVAADGNVRLIEQRAVYFEAPGDITEISVEKGDLVRKGDVIARLDPETLDKDIKSLEFAVRLAEIDLATTQDAVALSEIGSGDGPQHLPDGQHRLPEGNLSLYLPGFCL